MILDVLYEILEVHRLLVTRSPTVLLKTLLLILHVDNEEVLLVVRIVLIHLFSLLLHPRLSNGQWFLLQTYLRRLGLLRINFEVVIFIVESKVIQFERLPLLLLV